MNITAQVADWRVSHVPAGVSIAREASGVTGFRDAACAAVVWDRDVPSDVLRWLADLPPSLLPNARVVVQPSLVEATIKHLCDISQMPKSAPRDWLAQDIAALAQTFADVMQTAYLRLRLQAVNTNACRKFHLDAITGRLVCTYRGMGTQYGTSNTGNDPVVIPTVPTGAPILLRG